jgi:hypothetical protein
MNLFQPKQPSNLAKVEDIRGWVADLFGLQEEAVVLVSELRCTEPGCPPLETVIAIMGGPGRRRQFKIDKSIADILFADVAALESGVE